MRPTSRKIARAILRTCSVQRIFYAKNAGDGISSRESSKFEKLGSIDVIDFRAHLARQLRFIERSAKAYDEGQTDEAFRIATALRVIFRQTRKSTSLLTHLDAPNVLIRSTVPDLSAMFSQIGGREAVGMYFISLVTITMTGSGGVILPKKDIANHHRMIPADQWWNEMFASINGADYTRSGLVLCACENDGGAHVDADLPPNYAAIKASGSLGTFIHNGQSIPIEDAHLAFLRTMAFEVLNSSELQTLAGLF